MKENNVETGRSMLETLAVLAIIMVITIASIAGFDYLVQYRNRMETVKTVDLLVSSIKSGDLGRRRAQSNPNEVWDAGEIVKGPEIDDQTLVLPDSEHSYAVVRTLKNGGWIMAMQINPKTCDDMFKALEAQGASVYRMFDNNGQLLSNAGSTALGLGDFKEASMKSVEILADDNATYCGGEDCRQGVNLKRLAECEGSEECRAASERKKALIKACKEGSNSADSEGVVAGYILGAVAVCPAPVDAGGNFVGYDRCGRCIGGKYVSAQYPCCPNDEAWGDTCYCDRDYRKEDATGVKYCAQCNPGGAKYDAELCTKNYGAYKQHVCVGDLSKHDEHCGECTRDAHCQMDDYMPDDHGYTDGAFYEKFKHDDQYYMYCLGNKCRECTQDYDPDKEGQYPANGWPLREGNESYCPSDRPVCTADGACTSNGCRDDKVDEADTGCTDHVAGKYLCMPTAETQRKRNSGNGALGTECKKCFDSHPKDASIDDFCNSYYPLCKPISESNKYGNGCYKCQRGTETGASFHKADLGCEGDTPVCPESVANSYSTRACVSCIDDAGADDGVAEVDTGCAVPGSAGPLCQPQDMAGFDILNPQGKVGNACKKCYNDNEEGRQDTGCSVETPNCVLADGMEPEAEGFGDKCVASVIPPNQCKDTQTGGKQDSGCPMTDDSNYQLLCVPTRDNTVNAGDRETGTQCKRCFDSNDTADPDDGCNESGKPLCGPLPLVGKYGDTCYMCQRGTATGPQFNEPDLGCSSSNQPLCYAETNKYGDACKRCKDDAADGNVDTGCAQGTGTGSLCNVETHAIGTAHPEKYGAACMKCYNDKNDDKTGSAAQDVGCDSAEQPYCQASMHQYGNSCGATPPPAQICPKYVVKNNNSYAPADCVSLFGRACTPDDCPVLVIDGSDDHACLCSEPESRCPDGYYGKQNGQVFEIGNTKTACENSDLAQQYEGLCADTNCPAEMYKDLQVCMCAVPPVEMCAGGYYYYDAQQQAVAITAQKCREYGEDVCSPDACPEQTITYQGNLVANACVCQLPAEPCADGYYGLKNDTYDKLETPEECQPYGGCEPENFVEQAIVYNETPLDHACVAELTHVCPEHSCYHPETESCIEYEDQNNHYLWDDLDVKQDTDGTWICPCYDVLATEKITDASSNSHGQSNSNIYDGAGGTHLSTRTVVYSTTAKFYCPRYLYVEATNVDDFISSSDPAGVGSESAQWFNYAYDYYGGFQGKVHWLDGLTCEAFYGVSAPNHSEWPKGGVKPDGSGEEVTFSVTVQDYWLTDVGMNGYFYFPTAKYPSDPEGGQCYARPPAEKNNTTAKKNGHLTISKKLVGNPSVKDPRRWVTNKLSHVTTWYSSDTQKALISWRKKCDVVGSVNSDLKWPCN